MAEVALVDLWFNEGQRLIDRLAQEGDAVPAAAWVKESESGDWYLYLATPLVGRGEGKRAAYHRVNEVIRKLQEEGFWMDPYGKKVIGPNDPIARDLVAHRQGRPGGPPTLFRGGRLGDLAVEEAYIYPRPPSREEADGMRLWNLGHLELRPGVRSAGLCRTVVIDMEKQTLVDDRRYRGPIANPQPLSESQLEVTWAEGGAVRIVGPRGHEHWTWSQPRATWVEGGCPPSAILDAIFTAIG